MHAQRGFSLLETMIAGVVASLGLSGLAALLIATVSGTSGSGHRARALDLAVEASELMRLSSGLETVFLDDPPATTSACGQSDGCDATQFAMRNVQDWHLRLGLGLPGGSGTICRDTTPLDGQADDPACDDEGDLVVKAFWREPGGAQRLVLTAGE